MLRKCYLYIIKGIVKDDEGNIQLVQHHSRSREDAEKMLSYIIKVMIKMMKGTCNLYRIIAVAEKMLRK